MTHLSLSLLGPFQATLDGQLITGFDSAKVRALLAYLAVEGDRPHSREVLAGLLWPDYPDRSALNSLRSTLANLRQVIGDRPAEPPFLLITRDTIQFNLKSDYALDLPSFENLPRLSVDRLEQVVALHRGSFLEGFSCDSAPFEEWILLRREQTNWQMLNALHRLAAHYEECGEYEHAITYARKQLGLEPWDEEAHRQLMRALALGGQRSAALAQFEICRRTLMQELSVAPSPKTTALYVSIRDGSFELTGETTGRQAISGAPAFLVEEQTVEPPRAAFVARERELAQLNRFLDATLAGQGRAVFVTGEPGSGKTALIQEFTRQAMGRHRDLIVAQGNGNAHVGVGDPYLPFIETLQMLTGDVQARWAGGAITREHARRLWHLLPDAVQALMDVGPELVDRFMPGAVLAARGRAYASLHPERSAGAVWLARLDALLTRKAAVPPDPVGVQQANLFEQYTGVLQALARQRPLILVLDDLQWTDAGSISLLFHLGKQLAGCRILIVGAYRPEDVALGRPASTGQWERHPLEALVNEFQRDWGDIRIDLAHAEGRPFVDALLDVEPNCLGETFRQTLFQHTGGHPLFTVELLRGLQERGDLKPDRVGRWVEGASLNWDKLPARVEAVIAERVGRLPDDWRALLTAASVEGVEFTAEAVARVQDADEHDIIWRLSGELSRRRSWVSAVSCQHVGEQRLSRYRFRHYLFQKYLYNSLDKVERTHLHEALGRALETLYGAQVAQEAVTLAWHFEAAGQTSKAVDHLLQAGEQATRLAANPEAIAHLSRGLALLQTLPESPERDRRELALQLALGAPLLASKGYTVPELERAYARARELCQQMGETPEHFTARMGLTTFYLVRAEYQTALELIEQLFMTARQTGDPHQLAAACSAKGYFLLCRGEFIQARPLLEHVAAIYNPQQHQALLYQLGIDIGVHSLTWLALALLALGYPDQARQRSQEAIALAREMHSPFVLAQALAIAGAVFYDLCRDEQTEQTYTEELIHLGSGAGILQMFGALYLGHLKAKKGQLDGIALMRQGLDALWAVGHWSNWSHLLSKLVEGYGMAGQVEAGLDAVSEALAFANRTGERFYEPSLHQLRGELLMRRGGGVAAGNAVAAGNSVAAEASLRQAIEIAHQQQARMWELRAMVSLGRLLQTQGRRQEVRQRLAETYAWFTEGFDTPDLQEARALLQELA